MAKTPTKIASLARQHTERAIEVLAGIMNGPNSPEANRIQAANALLNRGWGMPKQDFGDEDGNGTGLTIKIVKFSDGDFE